jgi:hypothetical protein
MAETNQPVIESFLKAHPIDQHLERLVVEGPASPDLLRLVDGLIKQPTILGKDALAAGLYLYIDALEPAHAICQAHEGVPTFDFWHAILHRREGDFSNSRYWFRRAGAHPVITKIGQGYQPIQFVDSVEKSHNQGKPTAGLVELQRAEWLGMFRWCEGN